MSDQDTQYQEFAEVDEVPTEVLDEVDTPDEETDEPSTEPATKVKKVKASQRPAVPAGYITPVQFAKKLSARLTAELRAAGKLAADEEIEVAPQMIYSYLNQAKKAENAKHPLPSYSEGGRDNLLKEEEAMQWWDDKEARKAARATTAGGKKKTKTVAEVAAGEAVEVEEAE